MTRHAWMLVAAFAVTSCGFKPIARTVRDAARGLCELFAAEQAEATGISAKEAFDLYCVTDEALAPWIDQALRAKQAAGAAALKQQEPEQP